MGTDVSPEEVFSHESCSYPTALFEKSNFLFAANKPQLSQALENLVHPAIIVLPEKIIYILDGGSLLQRLSLQKGHNYDEIISKYVDYVLKRFSAESIVVFDGYTSSPSTKDMTHLRRSKGKSSTEVHFSGQSKLNMTKEQFLSNSKNKQRFIDMLSSSLRNVGISTIHAPDDADLLIVTTAVDTASSANMPVAVSG